MVDKIKIRFAEDIGKPNRITSDKATFRMKHHKQQMSDAINNLCFFPKNRLVPLVDKAPLPLRI